ncbi:MAG: hypothetical protein KAW12_24680 [Candidatus Aminicenantes bacterium]|nr:hypothetical protein [Candidatus Aminicenantes bacterium]
MDEKEMRNLLNRTINHCYVNLHARGNPLEEKNIRGMLTKIKNMLGEILCITVEIKNIPGKGKKNEEKEEANYLKDVVNEEMTKKQFRHWIHDANSIDHLLHQLNKRLEDPVIIIFHQFKLPNKEEEKNILRSIRKFIQLRESRLLKLLMVSSEKLDKWDLRPYSDMDERAVEYILYE